jgi:hypothetical protein
VLSRPQEGNDRFLFTAYVVVHAWAAAREER